MTITVGEIRNYGGDNYKVTRYEPDHFLCGDADSWGDAVAFTDHVGTSETATVEYVTDAETFDTVYALGEITEGAEASTLPADQLPPPVATQLPADKPEADTKD